jgi:hypothetical protein
VEHRFNVESASVAFSSITTQGSHEFLDHTGFFPGQTFTTLFTSTAKSLAINVESQIVGRVVALVMTVYSDTRSELTV